MEKYNEKSSCQKCDNIWISTTYGGKDSYSGDVIIRKCSRCGYSWNEIPLDKK